MKKVIRLTESDLVRLVKRVLNENTKGEDDFRGKTFKAYIDLNQSKPKADFKITTQEITGQGQSLNLKAKMINIGPYPSPELVKGDFSIHFYCGEPNAELHIGFIGNNKAVAGTLKDLNMKFTGNYASGVIYNRSFYEAVSRQWCIKNRNGKSVLKTANYVKNDNQNIQSDLS